jgi:hypothetical protein
MPVSPCTSTAEIVFVSAARTLPFGRNAISASAATVRSGHIMSDTPVRVIIRSFRLRELEIDFFGRRSIEVVEIRFLHDHLVVLDAQDAALFFPIGVPARTMYPLPFASRISAAARRRPR